MDIASRVTAMPHPLLFRLIAFAGLVGSLAWAMSARGDIVIFKDGLVLNGKVTREGETITDPLSGQAIHVKKGAFFVISGPRRVGFSFTQVQDVDRKDVAAGADVITFGLRVGRLNNFPVDPIMHVAKVTPWDKKWERTITIGTISNGRRIQIPIKQRLTQMTPLMVKADALNYNWSSYYLTNELGVEEVRALLSQHKELQLKGEKKDADTRFKLEKFFAQAGWYDEAEKELNGILKDFPEQKEKVAEVKAHVRGLKLIQYVEETERANRSRRHSLAQQLLDKFPRQDVDEALQVRMRRLSTQYETTNDLLRKAHKFLKELPANSGVQKSLVDAAAVIRGEMNHDNLNRLEAFVTFAQEAEREREQKRNPNKDPSQLLALAVSGWLLGRDAADAKVENALRLWGARRFLLDYLGTSDGNERARKLKKYQEDRSQAVPVDEIAHMLPVLPPLLPERSADTKPLALATTSFSGKRNGLKYLVQLPPEYHPGTLYPVVIALHQVTENPKAMLERLNYHTMLNGYILVVPDWGGETAQSYGYSPEEHAAVLNVLLDVNRRFAVDSDRVFLVGVGEGGAMAYDVGLSHPDLFAGVVPVSANVRTFARRYGDDGGNAQNLPFYVVNGTEAGELVKQNQLLFDKWIPQGFPSLHIEYAGRGLEWFAWEQPFLFDWMGRKKRVSAFPNVGRMDFTTMRETDNRFYWLTAESIRPANLNSNLNWNVRITPARMHGRIAEGNVVVLTTRGIKQLTVWLGRDPQGRDMVDFNKPVTIKVNGADLVKQRTMKPSLEILLEDFYQRGDRQRLFFAKETIEVK